MAATELIRAPFERKRAEEANRRELANLPVRMDLEFQDFRKRLKESSAQETAAIVPTLMERIRGQAMARAELAKENVQPGTEAMYDTARRNIGGFTPEQISAPTSLLEAEELKDVLSPAISSANLGIERERNRIQNENVRDIRLANLYAPLDKASYDEFSNVVNTETNEPLSYRDIQLLKTGEARLSQVPEAADDLTRLRELGRLRKEGKLQNISLNQNAFTKVLQDFNGMHFGQLMQMYGSRFPFLLYKTDDKGRPGKRVDLGNPGALAIYLQGNPDLLEAFAASRLARDMNEVKNAEKATGFRLSSRALGYLSLIYQSEGRAHEHPDAEMPVEVPEEILRELGRTRVKARTAPQTDSTRISSDPLSNPAAPTTSGSSLFTGLTISSEQKYPEYLELQQGIQTRLRARTFPGIAYDSTKYREFGQDFVNQHRTPEQAVAWYRSLGVTDDKLRDLLEGDAATKKRALNERLSFALGSLQNARDAILVK